MCINKIITDRFILRPLTASDATVKYSNWLKSEKSARFIIKSSDNDIKAIKNYIEIREARSDVLFLGIFTKSDGEHIGNIKYEPIDFNNKSAVMGILIGESDWRGKGVAIEVILGSANWLYKHKSIGKIFLGVDKDNKPAIRAYIKAGFSFVESNETETLKMIFRPDLVNRLALGAAQVGLNYGVANQTGQPSQEKVGAILQVARTVGIDTLDTAIAYGNAEEKLGAVGVSNWNIITKLPGLPVETVDVRLWVEKQLQSSLQRLKVDRLHGLLLHRPADLLSARGEALYNALIRLKDDKVVNKIGISIYAPDELSGLLQHYDFDIVQSPFNIIDRRLIETGWLERLQNVNIDIHTRSIFLQGLLLMKPEDRPDKFNRWHSLWQRWHSWLKEKGITPLQACLGYALAQPNINRVIIGVDNLQQIQEIIAVASAPFIQPPDDLCCNDLDLINPSRW